MTKNTYKKWLLAAVLSLSFEANVHGWGGDYWNKIVWDFDFTPPGVPSSMSLSATSNSNGTWTVSWGSASGSPTNYRLEESFGGGTFGTVYSGSGRSFTVKGKRVNGKYYYRVKACKVTCSNATPVKNVTLNFVKPSSLIMASSDPDGQFSISWRYSGYTRTRLTAELQEYTSGRWTTVKTRSSLTSFSVSNASPGDHSYRLLKYASRYHCTYSSYEYFTFRYYYSHVYPVLRKCGWSTASLYATENAKVISVGKPGIPTYLRGNPTSTTANGYTLSWSASSHRPTGYQLQQAVNGGLYSTIYRGSSGAKKVSVAPGRYNYRVRSCRNGWLDSYCSGWRSPTGNKGTVVGVAGGAQPVIDHKSSLGDGNFRIGWDRSGNGRYYRLYRSVAPYGSSAYSREVQVHSSSSQSYDNNLSEGNYRYRVKACYDSAGKTCGAYSSFVYTQVLWPPVVPSGLTIVNKSSVADTTYTVQWNQNSRRVTTYEIYRLQAAIGGRYSASPSTPINNRTATTYNRTDGDGNYSYQVRACNEAGCSAYTPAVSTSITIRPEVPKNLKITDKSSLSDAAFNVNWDQQSNRVSDYKLLIVNYNYSTNRETSRREVSLKTANTYGQNLDNGQYEYSVRACNVTVCSNYTSIRTKVLHEPEPPQSVSVPGNTKGGFNVSVTYGKGLIERVELQHSVNDGAWGDSSGQSGHSNLYYNETSALEDEKSDYLKEISLSRSAYTGELDAQGNPILATYRFRLRACNEAGCSAFKATDAITVTPPGTPNSISLEGISHEREHGGSLVDEDGNYVIKWASIGFADAIYQLEEKVGSGSFVNITLSNPSATSFQFSSKAENDYSYQVRACVASVGCGPATIPVQSVKVRFKPSNVSGITAPETSTTGAFDITWAEPQPKKTMTHYEILINGESEELAYLSGNMSKSVTNMPDGSYTISVRACNDIVCSDYTQDKTVKLVKAPTELRSLSGDAVSDGNGAFSLSWTAPITGRVDYYEAISGKNPNADWSHSIKLGDVKGYQFTGIEGNHRYQVRACNELSCGPEAAHNVKVRIAPSAPGEIQGPGVTTTGDYDLAWAPAIGTVTRYVLEERDVSSLSNAAWKTVYEGKGTKASFQDVSAGIYEYQLKACNEPNCTDAPERKMVTVDTYTVPTPQAPSAAPDPGMPSGADSIGSIKGSFRVNEQGAASYHVPISVAPGTAGVTPDLSLQYNSASGNGLLGQGWGLGGESISTITRCAKSLMRDKQALAVSWSSKDRFCLSGKPLIKTSGTYGYSGSTYKTETESFAKITAKGGSLGHPAYFEVEAKDGSTTTYGKTSDSMQSAGVNKTLSWSVSKFADSLGNAIDYTYANDSLGIRLIQVDYAYGSGSNAHAKVEFEYNQGERKDVQQVYIAGSKFYFAKRLTGIKTYSAVNGSLELLIDYRLKYERTPSESQPSRLVSIEQCGANGTCLPETIFGWKLAKTDFAANQGALGSIDFGGNKYLVNWQPADINGDGLQDLVYITSDTKVSKRFFGKARSKYINQTLRYMINTGDGFESVLVKRYGDEFDKPLRMSVIDYNADGRSDLVVHHKSHGWQLYLSTYGGGDYWSLSSQSVNLPFGSQDEITFADVTNDGLVDAFSDHYYWPMQRDESNITTNKGYRFGGQKNVTFGSDFAKNNQQYVVSSIEEYGRACGEFSRQSYCSYYNPYKASVKKSAGDVNGDGITDFLVQKNGYQLALSDYSSGSLTYKKANDTEPKISDHELTYFVDFNADGNTDVLYWDKSFRKWGITLSTGEGFVPVNNYGSRTVFAGETTFSVGETYVKMGYLDDISAETDDKAEDNNVQIADVNRDDFPDIVWESFGSLYAVYWDNQNQRFSPKQEIYDVVGYTSANKDDFAHVIMDSNGDGLADYVEVKTYSDNTSANIYSRYSGDARANVFDAQANVYNVIKEITNGLGATTEITYERMNASDHYVSVRPSMGASDTCWSCEATVDDYTDFNTPFKGQYHSLQQKPLAAVFPQTGPVPLVTSIRSNAPTVEDPDAMLSISYYYAQLRTQAVGYGHLGFKYVRSVDDQTGVETTTTYRQDWPFVGFPEKTITRTKSGHLLSESSSLYALQNWQSSMAQTVIDSGTTALGSISPYMRSSKEISYALASNGAQQGEKLSESTLENSYDDYGNVLTIKSVTKNSGGTINTVKTSNSYGSSDYDKKYGRLSKAVVVATRPGVPSQTKTSVFTYINSGDKKGLLQTETIMPEGGIEQKLVNTFTYDSFGNRVQSKVSGWDGTSQVDRLSIRLKYDSSGRYVEREYKQFPSRGEVMVSQVIARNSFGAATQVQDVNGHHAYSYFTPLGRVYFTTTDLGGWSKTWSGSADSLCPAGTKYTAYSESATGAKGKECFDMLSRNVRKLTQGFDGRWVANDTQYDSLGRTHKSSQAYYASGQAANTSQWVEITAYDLLNRNLTISTPSDTDGSAVTKMEFDGLSTTTINAHNQRKTEHKNALGEIVKISENSISSANYSYDAVGNLLRVRDAAGNTTTIVYDNLGRKKSMSDPDKGNWSYQYNAFGELVQQTDAKGQVSKMVYDRLGRMVKRIDKKADGSIEQTSVWAFDSQTNGLGQLASTGFANNSYLQEFSYDSFGRNSQTKLTLGGLGAYYQTQTFDPLGRVFQSFDASSQQDKNGVRGMQTLYNEYGYAYQVVDARRNSSGNPLTTYQEIQDMDARGNVVYLEQADGGIISSKEYHAASGLLKSVNSSNHANQNIQSLAYQWDKVGNLAYRKEQSGNKDLEETFAYDGLNRLQRSTVSNATQTIEQSLTYDAIGNIKTKSDVGSYSYGAGTAGPHAVTQAGSATYAYDANGNNVSGDGRVLEYSTFDKVVKVTKGTEHISTFAYGPDRSRYKRVDINKDGNTKTTWYLGNVEIIDHTGGAKSGVREYKRNLGMVIETLEYKAGKFAKQSLNYLLHDHLGSIDVITDELGEIQQELSFDAWGQRRNASSWQALAGDALTQFDSNITTRGYTGHEMVDGVGIIHMNGRIYDPKLARFLQADPIVQEPYMTQSMNRYTYVMNNPLNKTDPSGFLWWVPILKFVASMVIGAVVSDVVSTLGIKHGWSSGVVRGLTLIINLIAMEVTGLNGALSSATTGQIAVIAVIGGIASYLQGGKFGHGFISAGISARMGASDGIKRSMQAAGPIKKFITQVTIGGTVSRIGGGKFANGAGSAAFSMMLDSVYGAEAGAAEGENREAGGTNNKVVSDESEKSIALVISKLDHQPLKGADLTDANKSIDQGCGQFKCRSRGGHAGVDIHAAKGTEIGSAGDGIARIGYLKDYGQTVLIDHGDGVLTRYAHLQSYGVADKTKVSSGQFIGTTGISGNVVKGGDPHLHFEIMVNERYINPSSIFIWGNQ